MVSWDDEQKQAERAQAASLMLPWPMAARVCAEHADIPLGDIEDASDNFIIGILRERGMTREEMEKELPELALLPVEQREQLLDALGLEKWFAENIRRAVRQEDPLPFGLGVGGVVVDASDKDSPVVVAVATRASDPEALSKIFVRRCRETFGKQAFRDVSQHSTRGREHPFPPEQMVAMHDRGLSYREIAIQSLRDEYPGIIERPEDFKAKIRTERARIIKVIRAARELWNSRMPEDSIG